MRALLRGLSLLLAAALFALAALPASAHGAPDPADQRTRVLSDVSDDCGPEQQGINDCRGSSNLIALDLQEVHEGGHDVVVFYFVLDKGSKPTTVSTTLNTPGGAKTLGIKTTNDASFSVDTGFESVGSPKSLGDGSRYSVEARIQRAGLGDVGASLSGFKVEAKTASGVGDLMPGSCNNSLTACPAPSQAQQETAYAKPSYALRGPSYYVRLTPPTPPQVEVGSEKLVELSLLNQMGKTAQRVHLAIDNGAGFHQGAATEDAQYQSEIDVDLPAKGSTSLHIRLAPEAEGHVELHVTATTDLGGRTTTSFGYDAVAGGDGGPDGGDGGDGGSTSEAPHKTKGSPAPAAALTGLAILGLALARRRD